jgi:serine/threonine protein phosphatase PrpC
MPEQPGDAPRKKERNELTPITIERAEGEFWRAVSATAASEKHPRDNQDIALIDAQLRLFVLCDGMGGYGGGRQAARCVAESIQDTMGMMENDLDDDEIKELLPSSLQNAMRFAQHDLGELRKAERQKEHSDATDMETTATALQLWKRSDGGTIGAVGHVGDCRAYLISPAGEVRQITDDQDALSMPDYQMILFGPQATAEQKTTRAAAIRRELEEARSEESLSKDAQTAFNWRNRTAGVGSPDLYARAYLFAAPPGSRLVLMSDGVYENFWPENLNGGLSKASVLTPEAQARELVALAQQHSREGSVMGHKPDDMSVIVIDVTEAPQHEEAP